MTITDAADHTKITRRKLSSHQELKTSLTDQNSDKKESQKIDQKEEQEWNTMKRRRGGEGGKKKIQRMKGRQEELNTPHDAHDDDGLNLKCFSSSSESTSAQKKDPKDFFIIKIGE